MAAKRQPDLSKRERQIMDALYRLGRASAAELQAGIPSPPGYTAVRTHLTLLHEKGLVRYQSDGVRYIYEPVVPRDEMARRAVKGVLDTFFGGSVEQIVATLLSEEESSLSEAELKRLAEMIEQARREGR